MSESIQATTHQIVVFTLDEQSFALPLQTVVKVIHAIEIRHLPKAPEIITGIINVNGRIIPVADIRKRIGLPVREIDPDNRLIIANTGKREVAVLVDSVSGTRDLELLKLPVAGETLAFAEHIKGVVKVDDDLVLICDLDEFLSLDEEKKLDKALTNKNDEV
jgi:purine-binding chemotaxis protein CheW